MSLSFNFRLKEGQPAPFRIFVAKVLVVIATRVAATDPDKGVTKYDRSDFAVAFDELGPLVQDMVTPWSRTPWGTCAKMAREHPRTLWRVSPGLLRRRPGSRGRLEKAGQASGLKTLDQVSAAQTKR